VSESAARHPLLSRNEHITPLNEPYDFKTSKKASISGERPRYVD
jgi:hypothetical protein